MRNIFQIIASLFLIGLAAGCLTTSAPIQRIEKNEAILRVGVTPDAPPVIQKQGERISGLEADLARAVAARLDREVRFVEIPWDQLIEELEQDHIDVIMSGMSVTQLRAMRVQFTRPYLQTGQFMLVDSSLAPKFRIPNYIVAGSNRVGVVKGTTGDIFVQRNCRKADRQAFKTLDAAVQHLLEGKLDAVVNDAPMILHQAARHEAGGVTAIMTPLTQENLAWAVRSDNAELLEQLNSARDAMMENGKIRELVLQWIPFYRQLLD